MSDHAAPPRGTMYLYDQGTPPLKPGHYMLAAQAEVQAPGETSAHRFEPSYNRYFVVEGMAGAALPITEVAGVYPPPNGQGVYSNSLPQIVLFRQTLPWESGKRAPWLALLLLTEHDYSGTIGDTLSIPRGKLVGLLPREEERKLLCHIRHVNVDDRELGAGDSDGLFAVVIANRFPTEGCHHRACLVSLAQPPDLAGPAEAAVSLPVLYRWEFDDTGAAQRPDSFKELAQNLDVAIFGAPREAQPLVTRTGHIAVTARGWDGEADVAWYRGPLAPRPVARDPQGPYQCADQARRLSPDSGAEDISYAAAFELGRLLALSDARLAEELLEWRRRRYDDARRTRAADLLRLRLGANLRELARSVPPLVADTVVLVRRQIGPPCDPWQLHIAERAWGLDAPSLVRAWNLSLTDAQRLLNQTISAAGPAVDLATGSVVSDAVTAGTTIATTIEALGADSARLGELREAQSRLAARAVQRAEGRS